MSDFAPIDRRGTLHDGTGQADEQKGGAALVSALLFLLQPDPEAIIEVELVDQPVDLPQDQFEALLIDSECEV
jgi:hypothetical protein